MPGSSWSLGTTAVISEMNCCNPELTEADWSPGWTTTALAASSPDPAMCVAAEMLVGSEGVCSGGGGANLAPVSPTSVIRANARFTSLRRYQTSQTTTAGQATIFSTSTTALSFSSVVIAVVSRRGTPPSTAKRAEGNPGRPPHTPSCLNELFSCARRL
jgi:hypothetical protein